MELRLARRESQRPELQTAIGMLDNRVKRDLGWRGQFCCNAGFQHQTRLVTRTGNGDGVHREGGHGLGPCTLHNPSYDFNDQLIPLGATLWVKLAQRWLAQA